MFQLNNLFSIIPQFYQNSLYAENLVKVIEMSPNIEKEEGLPFPEESKISIDFINVDVYKRQVHGHHFPQLRCAFYRRQ